MRWVRGIFTANDKFDQFKRLLRFPLPTNDLVDSISDEYGKVFDSQDSYRDIDFSDPNLEADFQKYLEDNNDTGFWHETAFAAMMKAISSIIIVDLPEQQTTDRPAPYVRMLDIEQVRDISVEENGEIEYIIFCDGEDRLAYFDDEAYHIFYIDKENKAYIEIVNAPHMLGECPARFFWSDTMSTANPALKQAPLSGILSKLDWLLYFETAKQALDLYASYPIYWAYQSKCDYTDHLGNHCESGKIVYFDEKNSRESVRPCPICQTNKIVGAGSFIEKPVPTGDKSIDGNPAGVISIDVASLTYQVDECDRLKAQIYAGATGKMKLLNTQAVNQDQVQGQFESQTNILCWIARNFEKAHKWTYDIVCKLRYGDKYLGCTISYGTKFYLQSLSDAVNDFQVSKTSGVPQYILANKISNIENLQTRNNPELKTRFELLKNLEPYSLLSLKECKDLGIDVSDKNNFVLKCNFANFVSKFETEYGSICEFGSLLSMSERISRILTKLKEYGKENTTQPSPVTNLGGGKMEV